MEQGPIVLALTAAGFFGLALALTPLGLRQLGPLAGASVSIPAAAIALWLTVPFLIDTGGFRFGAVAIFAAVGLLFPVSVTLLTFIANRKLGPGVTAALGNLAPLFAILFAILVLGEMPGAIQVVGVVIVVAGVTLLAFGQGMLVGALGAAFLLPVAAAAIRGLVQPVTKLGLSIWPDAFAAVLIGYTVSAMVILLAGQARNALPTLPVRAGTWWFAAVGLCNAAAVLTLYAALARGPVSLVAPLVGTYPLVTLILGLVIARQAPPGGAAVVGIIVTVIGVVVLVGG